MSEPRIIYLQDENESDQEDGRTWCEDKINAGDTEYILKSEYNSLQSELAAGKEAHSGVCEWTQHENGIYSTSCGHSLWFDSGEAKENDLKYCGYCGKKLVEKPLPEPTSEEE